MDPTEFLDMVKDSTPFLASERDAATAAAAPSSRAAATSTSAPAVESKKRKCEEKEEKKLPEKKAKTERETREANIARAISMQRAAFREIWDLYVEAVGETLKTHMGEDAPDTMLADNLDPRLDEPEEQFDKAIDELTATMLPELEDNELIGASLVDTDEEEDEKHTTTSSFVSSVVDYVKKKFAPKKA